MQLLHETAAMRKRAYLLPKEHMVHKLWPSVKGEHEFFHYNEQPEAGSEEAKKAAKLLPGDKVFYSVNTRQIADFWTVPLHDEVMAAGLQLEQFRTANPAL
jgi:hypothetical protein